MQRAARPATIMSFTRTAAVVLVAAAAAAGPASAKPDPGADPEVIDISEMRSRLIVLTNDDGLVVVVDPKFSDKEVFAGDGKVMYQQRVVGGGMDGTSGTWDYSTWAPRANNRLGSLSLRSDKKYWLACGTLDKNEVEMRKLPAKESERILATAQFRRPLWKRQGELLARDDVGTYYYVDRFREEEGRGGHRVFIGKKGAMKELAMTNLVDDSAGKIYGTKRGEIRIVTRSDNTAYWVRGRKKFELVLLPVQENVYLIYRDLGVYGALGTLCDDL
ncbi:MAG: hypothetical protein KA190_12420 [Kofleriaceae bacterium]|nr:hypothetical protein [Kofleriaceae bacterium]